MTTDAGRKTIAYLVRCALASNDTLTKRDQNGTQYTFPGGMGLCPQWKNGGVATDRSLPEHGVRLHDGAHQHLGRSRPAVDGLGVAGDRLGREPELSRSRRVRSSATSS